MRITNKKSDESTWKLFFYMHQFRKFRSIDVPKMMILRVHRNSSTQILLTCNYTKYCTLIMSNSFTYQASNTQWFNWQSILNPCTIKLMNPMPWTKKYYLQKMSKWVYGGNLQSSNAGRPHKLGWNSRSEWSTQSAIK